MTNYPILSFAPVQNGRPFGAVDVIKAYVAANKPLLLMGAPGVGKTAIVNDVAHDLDRRCVTIIASTCDVTDFGGFPVVKADGAFDRVPMRAIRIAADEPCILFLDEISTAPPEVQAALLRGVYERVFGDVTLHPDTVIIAAGNPPEQAPGGHELSAPLIGRFAVYDFQPTIPEVQAFFTTLGEPGSRLRHWAVDWAATVGHAVDLLHMTPPRAAITDGALWAAPRAWERGLRAVAAIEDPGRALVTALLAGSVGSAAAGGFVTILKMRDFLPTIDEILADPTHARIPVEPSQAVGALGLLAHVAATDCWSAWLYAERLPEEIRMAAARTLAARKLNGNPDRVEAGKKAMVKLLSEVGTKALGGGKGFFGDD